VPRPALPPAAERSPAVVGAGVVAGECVGRVRFVRCTGQTWVCSVHHYKGVNINEDVQARKGGPLRPPEQGPQEPSASEIRDWARQRGIWMDNRGRIPKLVREMFLAAAPRERVEQHRRPGL